MDPVVSTIINVLTFFAIIVGFFGGLPKLLESFISPNLQISDLSIERYKAAVGRTKDDIFVDSTILRWEIKNGKRFRVFGSNALEIETHWMVGIIGQEGKWAYRSEGPEKLSFLALTQKWPQATRIDGYFPDEDYIVDFQMTSKGKASGSIRIPYPKENLKDV